MPIELQVARDALVTYLIHPGMALYVAYTDRLKNLAFTSFCRQTRSPRD